MLKAGRVWGSFTEGPHPTLFLSPYLWLPEGVETSKPCFCVQLLTYSWFIYNFLWSITKLVGRRWGSIFVSTRLKIFFWWDFSQEILSCLLKSSLRHIHVCCHIAMSLNLLGGQLLTAERKDGAKNAILLPEPFLAGPSFSWSFNHETWTTSVTLPCFLQALQVLLIFHEGQWSSPILKQFPPQPPSSHVPL